MMQGVMLGLERIFDQTYSTGHSCHGDLRLGLAEFRAHLLMVIEKHLGPHASDASAISFINNLHTNDLYLATACAQHSAVAWSRFMSVYQHYVNDLALYVSPTTDAARELAASVLVDMFLPDRSGHSRIASYDGRSSLATWLRVIVSHRAINERSRMCNSMEHIDSVPEIADASGVRNIEMALRADRYDSMIKDALKSACKDITDRERLILLFRYDEELQVTQIARLIGVHPSTVTRQLERIQEKLRDKVILILTSKYCLEQTAVEECLADITENPSHSILNLIKQV